MFDSYTLTLVHYKHNTYSPNILAHTSLLDTYIHQLLTLIHCYTLATYGTNFTTSHISHLMLYDTLHFTHITSLSHISLISRFTSHTSHQSHTLHFHIPPHLFILGVCWLGNQLEASSFFFLNTLFTKLLEYSINMWSSFTSTQKSLEISNREIWNEHHGEISGMQENFLENSGDKQIEWNSRNFQREIV